MNSLLEEFVWDSQDPEEIQLTSGGCYIKVCQTLVLDVSNRGVPRGVNRRRLALRD